MFRFSGTIDRRGFVVGVGIRIALLAGVALAAIVVVWGFLAATRCTVSACGFIPLFAAMIVAPLLGVLFLISLVGLIARRLRDMGVPAPLGLFVPLLLAGQDVYGFLPFLRPTSAFISLPLYLLEALALLAVLCVVPRREGRVSLRTLGWPAWIAVAIAFYVGGLALLRAFVSGPEAAASTYEILRWVHYAEIALIPALIVLPPLVAYALWPRAGQPLDLTPPVPAPSLPYFRLGLGALAVTAVCFVIAAPDIGFAALMYLFPLVLPNVVLYFLTLLTLYLLVRRPSGQRRRWASRWRWSSRAGAMRSTARP